MRVSPIAITALLALGVSAHAQTSVPYATGFEASDRDGAYVVGSLDNQPAGGAIRWAVLSGTANIQEDSTGAHTGARFVRLESNATVDRSLSNLGVSSSGIARVWVEGWFRGAGSAVTLANANYPSAAEAVPASAIVHFSSDNGIEFLNGNGAGAGSPIAAGVPLGVGNENTWRRITLFLDFNARTWDAYVDGARRNSAPLGFRDNVSALNGFRNLSEAASFFDSFRIVTPLPGDANGDSATDTADIVAALNFLEANVTSTNYDPIFAANLDTAQPTGQVDSSTGRRFIDAADVVALADFISAR